MSDDQILNEVTCEVGEEEGGVRIDIFLTEALEDTTRSFVKKLIKDGHITIAGEPCTKPSHTVLAGDVIHATIPAPPPAIPEAEDIPLDILYEDESLLIVNKPSGLVVHPAPGHYTGTLVNAVLFHCPDFQRSGADLTRPGIVHRLDRDTSGVMVVAKNQRAFTSLAKQAADHSFDRRYQALVRGEFPEEHGRINATIGRSLVDHGRMTVTSVKGKEAVTNFEVLERFGVASRVGLQLDTGRTHQIRVHLRFAGRPVLGDPIYGESEFKNWPIAPEVREALLGLQGQALHAERLGITHPETGERMTFNSELPADFQAAVEALRTHAAGRKA
jgi:23S rRNA pseudouridine1911/1915/1917 synthase